MAVPSRGSRWSDRQSEIVVGIYPPDADPAGLFRGLARIAGRPGRSAAVVRARSARWARD